MALPDHTPGSSGYHVTIGSESQNRRAFWCTNGEQMCHTTTKRFSSSVRPGVAGRWNGPAYEDQLELDLEYEFDGAYDIDDAASSDPEATLEETLDWFAENIVDAAGDTRGRLAVTVEGKGGEWSGYLVVTGFERGDGLEDCAVSLSVLLPDGKLQPGGS